MGTTIAAELIPEELRNQRRSRVLLAAQLKIEGDSDRANLLNLSTHGAMMDAELPPRMGAKVTLIRGKLETEAEVVWVEEHRFGLAFRQPIHPLQVAAILDHA